MTPSINRLAGAAYELGQYILDAEWETVVDEFADAGITNHKQFKSWVTGYMYYNALVCVCEGNELKLNRQLEDDFEELVVVTEGVA